MSNKLKIKYRTALFDILNIPHILLEQASLVSDGDTNIHSPSLLCG